MQTEIKDAEENQGTSEVQCTFRTTLPDQYKISEELEIQLNTGSQAKDLQEIVKNVIEEEGMLDEAESTQLKSRKLQFMTKDVFLTTTLQDLMDKVQLTSESVIEIWYSFALDRPKQKASMPQEEWISVISALKHHKNLKEKSYVVGFANGDLKLMSKEHQELVHVRNLHEEEIRDVIFVKSDSNEGRKYAITCSEQPSPALKISEVDTKQNTVDVVAQVSDPMAVKLNGWNQLRLNPVQNDMFAASSQYFVKEQNQQDQENLGSIQLYKLQLDNYQRTASHKRQRTEVAALEPYQSIQVNGGVSAMEWLDGDNLVAGCGDHALKIVDIEKSYQVKQSIMTEYKVPTSLDTAQGNLVLSGGEDAVIRLYDLRESGAKRAARTYNSHQKYITQVKFNQQVENVFVSGSMDGSVRMWDLRNDELPLSLLKHKSQTKDDSVDFKIFACEWNGASQILSGGSDSHISVHTM